MRIIVDAMGGDHAPQEIVAGALRAARELKTEVVLVGRGAEILKALESAGIATLPKGVEIANAEDVVDIHDDPASLLRRRKDSSMLVGLRMLAEEKGDAMVSAGSTGGLLTASTLIVKRIHGVRRAALAPTLPTTEGRCVLVDCGANAECTPEFLQQFACMGSAYAKHCMNIREPRVGLLNIGGEDGKGRELQKEAYGLLQELDAAGRIHFLGNIEARDVPLAGADVVVSDGFSGNVLLKGMEGTAIWMSKELRGIFQKNLLTKLSALCCKGGIGALKEKMDYRLVGGTPFLGLTKPIVKAHGSSDALAIFHAVGQAVTAVKSGLCEAIAEDLGAMTIPKEPEDAE